MGSAGQINRLDAMGKKYIIAKGLNGSELLKALASRNNPQVNQMPLTPAKVCEEVLLSCGIPLPGERISGQAGVFIMLKILRENIKSGTRYFNSASYADAAMCHQALTKLRMQLGVEEPEISGISRLLSKPVIKAKNEAIVEELARPYLEALSRQKLLDAPALYRHLISQVSERKKPLLMGRAFFIEEYPVSPLEHQLTTVIFGLERIESISRDELFGGICVGPDASLGRLEQFSSYGSSNELRTVLDEMIKSGEPLDSFVIASPKPETFAHLLREYEHLSVPYTIGSGISAVHSRAFIDGTLDFKADTSGGMELQALIKNAGIAGFSGKELSEIRADIMKALSAERIFKGNSCEGKIHLSDLGSLPFINRKNVFIMGIEALAGTGNENAILLDGDIIGIRSETERSDILTSVDKTIKQAEDFRWMINLLKRHGKNVTVSYSYFDTAALKTQSKPAVFSSLEEEFTSVGDRGFFEKNLLPLSEEEAYMKQYKDGSRMWPLEAELAVDSAIGSLPELRISSTAAEKLVLCPYAFFVEKLLKITMPEEPRDKTLWLDAKETGSLCHEIISLYSQRSGSLNTREEKKTLMLSLAEERITAWQQLMPSQLDIAFEIENIKDICIKYVDLKETMPQAETLATELSIGDEPVIPGLLSIHGKADLIEKRNTDSGEEIYVLDAKTGKNVKQIEDDLETCVQALIYCELLNRTAYPGKVSGAVYLYPKAGRYVACRYNQGVSLALRERFKERIASIENAEGWKAEGTDACAFCSAKAICETDGRYRYFDALVKGGIIL